MRNVARRRARAACALVLVAGGCGKPPAWDAPPLPPWPHLEEAERRFAHADFSGVVDLSWKAPYKAVRERERVLFLVGESYYHLGRSYRACRAYLDLVEEFPFSAFSENVGQRLYLIARQARREGFTHVRLPNTHRTVPLRELLEKSLFASPYGPTAGVARLALGEIYLEAGQDERAAPLFAEIYFDQPDGAWAEEALWKAAATYRRLYAGRDYTETPLLKAEEAALEYRLRYPGGAHRRDVDALLAEIRDLRIERLEEQRRFYARRGAETAVRHLSEQIDALKRLTP